MYVLPGPGVYDLSKKLSDFNSQTSQFLSQSDTLSDKLSGGAAATLTPEISDTPKLVRPFSNVLTVTLDNSILISMGQAALISPEKARFIGVSNTADNVNIIIYNSANKETLCIDYWPFNTKDSVSRLIKYFSSKATDLMARLCGNKEMIQKVVEIIDTFPNIQISSIFESKGGFTQTFDNKDGFYLDDLFGRELYKPVNYREYLKTLTELIVSGKVCLNHLAIALLQDPRAEDLREKLKIFKAEKTQLHQEPLDESALEDILEKALEGMDFSKYLEAEAAGGGGATVDQNFYSDAEQIEQIKEIGKDSS
jgi:hypothetical protein